MVYSDHKLYVAPHDPHKCHYCGTMILAKEWAKTGKRWINADVIRVYWFHAACPVQSPSRIKA